MGKTATAMGQRASAGYFAERQFGAGGDDQVVIGYGLAVTQGQGVGFGVDGVDRLRNEGDALALQIGANGQCDFFALAPADRQPRVAGYELKVVDRIDDGDFVSLGSISRSS
jgi:hypothetical protein